MTPYFEPRFLACLLLRAPGSPLAWSLTQRFEPPFSLNSLHLVQIEGMIWENINAPEATRRVAARKAQQLWQGLWAEGVFQQIKPNWEAAFLQSLELNRKAGRQVARPTACMHVGLAATSGATHFLSFEPRTREAAGLLHLKVLPEQL